MYTGPKLISKDLVFGYDTGYGVADNATATRFYPGEATTNQADTDAKRNWGTHNGATSSTTTAPEKGPGWKKLIITNINGSNYRLAQFPYLAHANGTTRTYSVEFDVGSLTGYFMFVDGTNGYAQTNVSGKGRYSTTITASGGNKSIAIFLGKSGTHSNINHVIYYKEYQVEEKSHASPFTATSRSNTASLIDLKRTSNIDVTNVNFDSTGQPEFDGSDAYINVPYSSVLDTPVGATYELVFNPTGQGEMLSRGISDSGSSPDNPRIYWGTNGSIYFDWSIQGQDVYVVTSAADCPANQYSYIACTALPGQQLRVYVNGVEATYTLNVQTLSTPVPNTNHPIVIGGVSWLPRYFAGKIPVVKLHKRALTLSEIKENFKAYKNRFNI